MAWIAAGRGYLDVTSFDCRAPIVVMTSEFHHDYYMEAIFEFDCPLSTDDTGYLEFEDDLLALHLDISLMPDGCDFVSHGVGGELCTVLVPVFVAWHPTAGASLCIVGVGDSLYDPSITSSSWVRLASPSRTCLCWWARRLYSTVPQAWGRVSPLCMCAECSRRFLNIRFMISMSAFS